MILTVQSTSPVTILMVRSVATFARSLLPCIQQCHQLRERHSGCSQSNLDTRPCSQFIIDNTTKAEWRDSKRRPSFPHWRSYAANTTLTRHSDGWNRQPVRHTDDAPRCSLFVPHAQTNHGRVTNRDHTIRECKSGDCTYFFVNNMSFHLPNISVGLSTNFVEI
jgi:hypothetical protein